MGVDGTGLIGYILADWRSFAIDTFALVVSFPNLREGSLVFRSYNIASISVLAWRRYVSVLAFGKGIEVGEVNLLAHTYATAEDTIHCNNDNDEVRDKLTIHHNHVWHTISG